RLAVLQDDLVAKALPDKVFFTVLYPLYPRAVAPPKGLSAVNIFVAGDPVKPLTTEEELFYFLHDALPKATTDDQAKDAARIYLRLLQEMHQDGYYKFKLM